MWFRSWFASTPRRSRAVSSRRVRRAADRRLAARRLLLEGLEDRSLLAFNPFAIYGTAYSPQDLLLADVNGDDQLDMLVPSWNDDSVMVRLGNADGTFGSSQSFPTGDSPVSVAAGDLTGDGLVDLVTSNSSDLSLLAGLEGGGFAAPQSISLPPQGELNQYPRSVTTGDVNGDGKLDLVALGNTYYCPYYCYSNGYANVLLGNGGGLDSPVAHDLGPNYYPGAIAIGDVNGDLQNDIIAANNGYSYALTVLLNTADEPNELSLGSPLQSGSGYSLRSISLGDVDGDGKVDTLLGGGYGLYVQKGNGDGTFTAQPYVNTGASVHSAVMGDVDDDGNIDLVAVGSVDIFTCTSYYEGYWGGIYCNGGYNTTARQASVLMGNGQGSFATPLISSLGTYVGYSWLSDVAVAKLNAGDLPELVAIDYYSSSGIVAINDGDWDPPPSISISDADTVVEGDSGSLQAEFTVTIVGEHDGVSVDYWTADYTASAGSDYTTTSGTLTFAAGEFIQTILVPVHGDIDDESDEVFFVHLSNPVGGQVTDGTGTGTIQDDDTDPVLTISDAPTIVEGNSGTRNAVFTVTLEGDRKGGVATVEYSTGDYTAVAGADYTATSGTLTFAVNESSKEIVVPILGDTMDEYNEQFFVSLFNPSKAQIAVSYDMGTIEDDDAAPLVTINNVSRNEGNHRHNTSFVFTVSLSQASGKWVYVDFATANGTATTANSDYIADSGTIYFAPGETTTTITVTVRGDKTKESDETFYVNLSNAVDATISDSQGVGTIVNDDGGKGKPTKSSVLAALLVDDTVSKARKRK